MTEDFDELMYLIDGHVAVAGDIASRELEQNLVKLRRCSAEQRAGLLRHLEGLWTAATAEVVDAETRAAAAQVRVEDWQMRAGEGTGELAAQAHERAEQARADAEAAAEELAEYRATVHQIEQVRALVERVGGRGG